MGMGLLMGLVMGMGIGIGMGMGKSSLFIELIKLLINQVNTYD